jgi:hypothetical protein
MSWALTVPISFRPPANDCREHETTAAERHVTQVEVCNTCTVEPVSTGVAKVGGEAFDFLKKESESFLNIVLGEPAKALGGFLADKINSRRHANLITITVEAKRKLVAAGVSPKEVPLKIIHPLLEAASLEEDGDLQEAWANLLANAADPRHEHKVSITFPAILKELSTREVTFFETLYINADRRVEYPDSIPRGSIVDINYSERELMKVYVEAGLSNSPEFGIYSTEYYESHKQIIDADSREFDLVIRSAMRHDILDEATYIPPAPITTGTHIPIHVNRTYHFSHLGEAFMAACHPPARGERE